MPEGVAVVDKPAGWTSHDVVARVRRLLDTRKVGHAGTLDPMATGVLLVGVGRATRVLGYLAAADKAYRATVRLGQTTDTDDADGELVESKDATGIGRDKVEAAASRFVGSIEQVPPAYSAVKVAGRTSYSRARAGENVVLNARKVQVHRLTVGAARPAGAALDVDFEVECSTGTYVRSLARDLGAALGVGGHLVALRRTRVGRFGEELARPLDDGVTLLDTGEVVRRTLGELTVEDAQADALSHGRRLELGGGEEGTFGAFGPAGLVAIVEVSGGCARPLVVFSGTL